MKKFCFILLGMIILSATLSAQDVPETPFYHRGLPPSGSTYTTPEPSSFTGKSGTGANLDVVYQRISWTINPNDASKTITGTVTTHFRTLVPNVTTITMDLNTASFPATSVNPTFHGIACSDASAGNILTITLPSTIVAANTLDSITINYSGVPPGVVGAAQGYQRATTPHNYITSLSESYEDRDFWPCKADMQDKIDSLDIFVNVPWATPAAGDTFWVAANGRLVDSTITGTNRTFHFVHRYPIPSYLVAVSVARFDRYYRTVNINGTNTQVAFYLLRGKTAGTINTILTTMDNVTLALVALGNKYSEYPFKLDKHGFYDGLLGAGGMEHQTFSGIATSSMSNAKTLVHEVMHQWFGDNVSFASWNDLWLAEGFARYSEALAGELVPALGINVYTTRNGIKSAAIGNTAQSAWIPDANAATSDLQWNSPYGTTVYERGGMIVSMLRTMVGDSVFFKVMSQYQVEKGGTAVTTDTLKNYFNRELNFDISEFFKDYVGGSGKAASAVGGVGHPTYNINWGNPTGTTLRLQIASQTRSAGTNVAYFNGPLVLHVTNAATGWTKDTTIVMYDGGVSGAPSLSRAGRGIGVSEGNMLQYTLSFVPTNVFFDDSARLMASQGTVTKLSLLNQNVLDFAVKQGNDGNAASLLLDDNISQAAIILERSMDGVSFSELGQMNLANSTTNKNYNLLDTDPLNGANYYRAKFRSPEGNTMYTRIIKLMNSRKVKFVLLNNPVSEVIKVKAQYNSGNTLYDFIIYDAAGQKISQVKKRFTNGVAEVKLPFVTKGNYLVSITGTDKKTTSLAFIAD